MAEQKRSRRASGTAWADSDAHAMDARLAAMQWQVVLWSGEVSAEERGAFAQWLSAEAAHRAAWQHVQHATQAIRMLPGARSRRRE